MTINIYLAGNGTSAEQTLVTTAESALRSANLEAEINVITEISAIGERGLCALPAVEVDGRLVVQGRLARATEIAQAFPSWTCGVRPEKCDPPNV